MMMEIIKIEDLSLTLNKQTILDHINITFEEGLIYGIVGKNGSGKSMLFKCICGLVYPTSGKVFVSQKEIGKDVDFPEDTGILIEMPGLMPHYSAFKNLHILANLHNKIGKQEIRQVLEKVGLSADDKKIVKKYSLGMKQRLGIAMAIMENPKILILDEPMNSLDKQGIEDVRDLLKKMKAEGKTILLTSHNFEDITALCDKVYEMDHGKIWENKEMV